MGHRPSRRRVYLGAAPAPQRGARASSLATGAPALPALGWPTGTRTPTDGTRIRCPAIRRWANGKGQSTNGRRPQSRLCMGSGHLRREAPLVSVRGWGLVVEGLVGSVVVVVVEVRLQGRPLLFDGEGGGLEGVVLVAEGPV